MAREQPPRREKRTPRDLWDHGNFEDVSSYSTGEPPRRNPLEGWDESLSTRRPRPQRPDRRQPARPPATGRSGRSAGQGRRPPPSQAGRPAPSGRRPREAARRPAPSSARPRGRPQPQERRRKKPMSLFRRRLLIVLALLGMVAGTLFLVESLLLRVTSIQVAGDAVYAEEDILSICGYKPGDNLLLIPIASREEQLETQLPYVAQAKISRRIPGTVRVEITAARPVCSLQAGGGWYVVDASGKVLEARADPYPGVMQVTGLSPHTAQPGYLLGLEDESVAAIFSEILEAIDQLGAAGRFTRLDLSDTAQIRLWYEDRVEFLLGGPVELSHKLQYGYGLFDTSKPDAIQPEETGQLELSYLPESKRAFFNAGEVSPGAQPAQPQGGAAGTEGSGNGGDTPAGPTDPSDPTDHGGEGGGETPQPGRGSGIPDQIYTGG